MLVTLSGAHRAGKTTLAKALQDEGVGTYIPFKPPASILPHDPVGKLTLQERLEVQKTIMGYWLDTMPQYCDKPDIYITDRGGADIFAYMMAEIPMNMNHGEQGENDISLFIKNAGRAINHSDLTLTVNPLSTYQEEAGKPGASRAFQLHIHYLITGFLKEQTSFPVMAVADMPVNKRVEFVYRAIEYSFSRADA